nr:S8 family serine peptidase [Campylobacter curvus]
MTCILLSAMSANAYTEAGVAGNTSSWESAEYKKDWGLTSMNTSTAYAMGFDGKGINIGVMDSGMLLSHPDLNDGRIKGVRTSGTYYADGMRYPDAAYGNGPIDKNKPTTILYPCTSYATPYQNFDKTDNGKFKKGEKFDIGGEYIRIQNDSHGTHVGAIMASSRNGIGTHGIAFGSNLYSANTGGNDNMTYGPSQDYNYFLAAYTAMADKGLKVINNSWGSNRRVNSSYKGARGYSPNWDWRYVPEYDVYYNEVNGAVETNEPGDHIYLKNLDTAKQAYYQFVSGGQKTFLDAAYEVATKRQII